MPLQTVILGHIYTQDRGNRVVEAVGIDENRFACVGSREQVMREAGPKTSVIHLPGTTGFPGFTDAHGHLLVLAHSKSQLDLRNAESPEEVIRLVSGANRECGATDWIQGWGWDHTQWPTSDEVATMAGLGRSLDQACSQVPVYLKRIDGHAALVNRQGLAAAGISSRTPDPPGGRILRDHQGHPTGLILDRAMELIEDQIPPLDPVRKSRLLAEAGQQLASCGITATHEAGCQKNDLKLLEALVRSHTIPIRVVAMANAQDADLQQVLTHGPDLGAHDHRFTMRTVKVFVDGSLGSRGALLLDAYKDDPGNHGIQVATTDDLSKAIRDASRAGFQVAFHAIGDGAVRLVLDTLDRTMSGVDSCRKARFRIEHAQVISPEDFSRLASLGVVLSIQPSHLPSDMPWAVARLGKARFRRAYPWRSLLDCGVVLALGSDFPVEPFDPRGVLHGAVTRSSLPWAPKNRKAPGGPWNPEQALTMEEAIRAYTWGAAYAAFQEHLRGSVEVGKLADLTFFYGDPCTSPPQALETIRVAATIVHGHLVYAA